jgi:hypothetical protein
MKIVVNRCYGGFSISKAAAEYMAKLGDPVAIAEINEWRRDKYLMDAYLSTGAWPNDITPAEKKQLQFTVKYRKEPSFYGYGYAEGANGYERTSPALIKAVEDLGAAASGEAAKLEVVEIPDNVEWEIDEYDGIESIHEKHRSW